jgi:hypothetical protein
MLSCDHSATTGADSTPRRISVESENAKIVSAQALPWRSLEAFFAKGVRASNCKFAIVCVADFCRLVEQLRSTRRLLQTVNANRLAWNSLATLAGLN